MKKVWSVGAIITLICLPWLITGCVDCPIWTAGILRVRLLNGDQAGNHIVRFDVMLHGTDVVVASGSFMAEDESPEAYAMSDGGIYVFLRKDNTWDVLVYVDEALPAGYSTDDKEYLVEGVIPFEDDLLEVDYLNFTPVD